jgi:hypothetical protein
MTTSAATSTATTSRRLRNAPCSTPTASVLIVPPTICARVTSAVRSVRTLHSGFPTSLAGSELAIHEEVVWVDTSGVVVFRWGRRCKNWEWDSSVVRWRRRCKNWVWGRRNTRCIFRRLGFFCSKFFQHLLQFIVLGIVTLSPILNVIQVLYVVFSVRFQEFQCLAEKTGCHTSRLLFLFLFLVLILVLILVFHLSIVLVL